MYEVVKILHSYWAYLVVLIVFLASINAIVKAIGNKEYQAKDFRISLFGLIVTHIQVLIGAILFVVSPLVVWFSDVPVGNIMKDSTLRLYNVEHPLTMIISAVVITIGYSKHKKKLTSQPKLKTLAIFYTLGLILLLSRIPWSNWL